MYNEILQFLQEQDVRLKDTLKVIDSNVFFYHNTKRHYKYLKSNLRAFVEFLDQLRNAGFFAHTGPTKYFHP